MTEKRKLPVPRCEIYRDHASKFRFRRIARNGQITDTPGQSYTAASSARRAARKSFPLIAVVNREGYGRS